MESQYDKSTLSDVEFSYDEVKRYEKLPQGDRLLFPRAIEIGNEISYWVETCPEIIENSFREYRSQIKIRE